MPLNSLRTWFFIFHDKTKHFEIDWHFIQEKVEEKIIEVDFTSTTNQPADMLTKALSQIKFKACKIDSIKRMLSLKVR